MTSEVWIGDNGGGLRRVGAVVEALPLHSVRFGAVPRGYREVVALPRDPVALTDAVRGWAASPTDEENGAVPVGEALDQRTYRVLASLMVDWPLPEDLARTVSSALRTQPGVAEDVGVDPDGRPAIRLRRRLDAIVGPDVRDPTTGELGNVHVANAVDLDVFVDPDTFQLLSEKETVAVASSRSSSLRVGAVRALAVFGPTSDVAELPADLPRTRVVVVGGPWSGPGNQTGCGLPGADRVCALLENAGPALRTDETCDGAGPVRPWETSVVGVVSGKPVQVHWCGDAHAKPLLLALGPDTTFEATLTPIAPKSRAECEAIVARTRRERGAPQSFCKDGVAGNWYHAKISVTRGDGWIVSCTTTARDAHGAVVFAGRLGFGFAGMFGNLAVDPAHPREFDWYAQVATDAPFSVSLPPRTGVTTYETECVPNPTPPI